MGRLDDALKKLGLRVTRSGKSSFDVEPTPELERAIERMRLASTELADAWAAMPAGIRERYTIKIILGESVEINEANNSERDPNGT